MRRLLPLLLLLAAGRVSATVPTTTSAIEYTCNGSLSTFTLPFRWTDQTHLLVQKVLVASPYTATTLVLTTDYTVSGTGSTTGGTVQLVDAATDCPTGYKLRVRRVVPLTQPTAFSTQGSFNAKTHEAAMDRLTMMAQQLNDGALVAQNTFETADGSSVVATTTGSNTPRPLASRFADEVNVKDYGAVGDDLTDDTDAIKAAITSAGTGKTVFFPPGIYRHTGFTLNQSVILKGAGWMSTTLRNVSVSTPAITIERQPGSGVAPQGYIVGGVVVEKLKLMGTSTGAAVLYNTQSHTVLRDVYILSNAGHGVQLSTDSHVYGLTIDHCVIQSNTLDGVYGRGEDARQINAIRIINGTEIASNRNGVNLWGVDLSISNSIIENNGQAGVLLTGEGMTDLLAQSRSVSILDNYFEENSYGAIVARTTYKASPTTYHYINGLRIERNYIAQSTTAGGYSAAITMESTDGSGAASGAYWTYRGVVLADNHVISAGTIGYVDFKNVHGQQTRLTPFYGSSQSGGLTAFGDLYKGARGVFVVSDTYQSGAGAPTASADFIGQLYYDTGSNTWFRAGSAGGGVLDWNTSTAITSQAATGADLMLQGSAFDNAAWLKNGVTVTADVDGTADRLQVAQSTASAIIYQTKTVTAGKTYQFAFEAKNNGGTVAKLMVWDITHATPIVQDQSYFAQLNGSTYAKILTSFTAPAGCTQVAVYPVSTTTAAGETVDVLAKNATFYELNVGFVKFAFGSAVILNGQQMIAVDLTAKRFTAAPFCTVSGVTTVAAYKVAVTSTQLTVDAGSAVGLDTTVHYTCIGL